MKHTFNILFYSIVFLFTSCGNETMNDGYQNELFEKLNQTQTGVTFSNDINENENINGILYEYLYNGGGVAVGDFNNDGLPELFFVSNQGSCSLYLNNGDLHFTDITSQSNISETTKGFPTGVTISDINADGLLDIYLCRSGKFNNPSQRTNLLFINQGVSKGVPVFEEQGKKFGLDLPDFSTQASFFDFDRDGDLDMFLINHGPQIYEEQRLFELQNTQSPLQSEQLFENRNGYYINISKEAGIINNALSFGLGLAIGDLNQDQWPDVIVGHDFMQKDHIYINQKNGTFSEISALSTGHNSYFSMGNDISDFNNDGLLDFMTVDMVGTSSYDIKTSMSGMNPNQFYMMVDSGFHHQYMFNCLQLNQGVHDGLPRFSDIAQLAGVSNTDWSWSALFFDANNNGLKDLLVTNGIKRDFRNNDFVHFKKKVFDDFFGSHQSNNNENKLKARELTKSLIEKMPTRAKPNYLFTNTNGLQFEKSNWLEEENNVSNGAAFADLDNDGDLDFVLNNMNQTASIYKNTSKNTNYIQFKLIGSENNKFGIGARIAIKVHGNLQIIENYSTRGFQSASLGRLHFGLGDSKSVDEVIVTWSDGKRSFLSNIESNQLYEIDYKTSTNGLDDQELLKTIEIKIPFVHKENVFNDFEREGLLPHRMSRFGPAIAIGDVNRDGLDDIFVGGAKGETSVLLFQLSNGQFHDNQEFTAESMFEDVDAEFIDIDGDQDLDLYVVTGGNEYDQGSKWLDDRIYLNDGTGILSLSKIVPLKGISGGRIRCSDFDKDGQIDMLITGRQVPGNYPAPASTYLLKNNSSKEHIEIVVENVFKDLGMATDAVWMDIDGDTWNDLVIVGEWMAPTAFMNNNGHVANEPTNIGLSNEVGWWFSIATSDFNGDGKMDFVAGNNGLNYKYKASPQSPFEIFAKDFDQNGDNDIVLAYSEDGKKVPLRGRQCSSQEMPFIKESFKSYNEFANASLQNIYGENNLNSALKYAATTFASCVFLNNGDGTFKKRELPIESQLSCINTMHCEDINLDGYVDLIVAGNFYVSEVETTRNDAGMGAILYGNGSGEFRVEMPSKSHVYLNGDIRNMKPIKNSGMRALAVARNNEEMILVNY